MSKLNYIPKFMDTRICIMYGKDGIKNKLYGVVKMYKCCIIVSKKPNHCRGSRVKFGMK